MNSRQNLEPSLSVPIPLAVDVSSESEDIPIDLPFRDLWRNGIAPNCIQSFDAGFEILSYQPPKLSASKHNLGKQPVTGYLIIQGCVRLLCKSKQRQRPCSATVLRVGDIFGADHLFLTEPLSYFAVAASDCQVASVSFAQLVDMIDQHLALQSYWQKQMQERAQQIFFKCFTQLQPLSSKTLSRLLSSRIREHRVEAGVSLRAAIIPYEGYFWLRSGVLSCSTVSEQMLPIGMGWSDRNQQIAEWKAQTPLLIYQLHLQPWEIAEMLPVLEQLDL